MYIFIVGIVLIIVVCPLFYLNWKFDYWQRKKFPYIKAVSLFGSFNYPTTTSKNIGLQLITYYNETRRKCRKHFGIYIFWKPFYVPTDPEIIKNILIRDFDKFPERGAYCNEKDDPLTAHLLNLNVHKWRPLRMKLTQTFTSRKMKLMFEIFLTCGEQLKQALDKQVGTEIKIKDELRKYTMNVIGSCAFGIDCNAFEDTESEFIKHARKIFVLSNWAVLKLMFSNTFRKFAKKLGMVVMNKKMSKFLSGVIYDTVKYRETNKFVRNDFLQLLIQMKNGQLVCEDDDKKVHTITMEEIAAQAFIFFAAGYETSSSVATHALFELAYNQDIQQKLREEILDVLKNYDNQLTYECLLEMKYLDQIVDESLRKYPPAFFLVRESTCDFKIPGTRECLEEGTTVIIPTLALHYDPEYFPDPEKFDPDRFSEENRHNFVPCTYLPFGDGPRNCLGMRMGKIQIKVALADLLRQFSFSLNEKTQLPLTMDPQSFVYSTNETIWLNINRLAV